MIEVENLGRVYETGSSRQVVFDGLSFSVGKGETVALLGATSSGKTTIITLIPRFSQTSRKSLFPHGKTVLKCYTLLSKP